MNYLTHLRPQKKPRFACPCLDLEPSTTDDNHFPSCPLLRLPQYPNLSSYINDPTLFTPTAISTSDQGFVRINLYMTVLNYIRTHVNGCTIFYTVTDKLLKHIFAQFLPVIVGDQRYNLNPSLYHNYANLQPVPVRAFITTARQIGKTTTMAISLTALLCVADGQDLAKIYARTQNQAVNLLSEVKSIFLRLPLHLRPQNILKMNETTLSVMSHNDLPCLLQAAPGNVEGIRGHKPRIIVVDEYQFTLPEFWTQHIWALTQVTTRILLAASTPGEPGSYMAAETMKMKNLPLLYPESMVLDFSLVCQKHRDDDTPLLCRCRLDLLPPWKNVPAIRQAQAQYGDGNTSDFIQEVLGEPVSSGTRIFDPKLLAATFQALPVSFLTLPQGNVIYVAIDPSSGGESELAIATILYTLDSRLLILALDTALTKKMGAVDISNYVRAHLRLFRKQYPNTILIPIVEDQGGVPMAQTICDIFREPEFRPSVFLTGHKVDANCRSDGVPTTRPIKENMVMLLETLLKENRILLCDRLLTTGSRTVLLHRGNLSALDQIRLLATQLGALFYDDKKHITGKLGPGFKDDLAMAFLLAIYWSNSLRTKDRVLVMGQLVYNPFS